MFTLLLVAYGVLSFYPYKPVEYKQGSFQTDKLEYTQGDTGYYTVDYCKYNKTVPVIKKFFVDGIRLEMSNQIASLSDGCHQIKIAFTIPNINPDKYQIEIQATYQYNPFQKAYVSTNKTNWFTIKLNPNNDIDKEV
jgi:hypothetical protein